MSQEYVGWIGDDREAEAGFPAFVFEANRAFGHVASRATLDRVMVAYPWPQMLGAQATTYDRPPDALPEFGFRAEHRGSRTLADHFRDAGYPVPASQAEEGG